MSTIVVLASEKAQVVVFEQRKERRKSEDRHIQKMCSCFVIQAKNCGDEGEAVRGLQLLLLRVVIISLLEVADQALRQAQNSISRHPMCLLGPPLAILLVRSFQVFKTDTLVCIRQQMQESKPEVGMPRW